MDIRKWLDETVLPAQPPSPRLPEQALPAPLLPSKQAETRPKEKRKRKRTRSTSDSSILDVRTERRQPSPIGRQADTVDSGGDSACSDAHQPPDHSSRSSSSSHQYARKPRRRTRPEHYEPASKDAKERGTKGHRHKKGESKKSKHKSRRKKTEKPGAGLVQSFHAKNVPQDRLTLKPREKLGLFNKGRVSSPVKGRGLPDLVFSEMKFLQKHRDQPEAIPEPGVPKQKKRKKDHAHSKQEEISAYFTTVQPALAEKDANTQAKEGTLHGRERKTSSVADHAIPTVEVPEKGPYLGFGSRGPRHESASYSYVSWSESNRGPSATPRHVQASSVNNAGQLGSVKGSKVNTGAGGGDMLHSYTPPSVSRRFTNGSVERFHVSSSTPANQRLPRAHSFPQRTWSPVPHQTHEQPEPRRRVESAASPSSMPAGIPVHSEVRPGGGQPQGDMPPPKRVPRPEKAEVNPRSSYMEGDESNGSMVGSGDPNTSSTLGRLLQQCNSVFDEYRRQAANPRRPHAGTAETSTIPGNNRPLVDTSSYGPIRSVPTVRFSGVETYHSPVRRYAGPGIYEEQERRNDWEEEREKENDATIPASYLAEEEFEALEEQDDLDYTHEELSGRASPVRLPLWHWD